MAIPKTVRAFGMLFSRKYNLHCITDTLQGWIQGWKTDGVIIDASMLRGRLRELGGVKRHRGSRGPGAQPPEIFWSLLSGQTTRRSNLALAGRRLNRIFMDF